MWQRPPAVFSAILVLFRAFEGSMSSYSVPNKTRPSGSIPSKTLMAPVPAPPKVGSGSGHEP